MAAAGHAVRAYLAGALPAIARRLSRSPDAYDYLAESIKDWPAQPELARTDQPPPGWSAVRWRDLSLGVVALHLARRPDYGRSAGLEAARPLEGGLAGPGTAGTGGLNLPAKIL